MPQSYENNLKVQCFCYKKKDNIVARIWQQNFQIVTFYKFNTKIFSFPMVLCKKVYLCNII